jgi:hypothetical protein
LNDDFFFSAPQLKRTPLGGERGLGSVDAEEDVTRFPRRRVTVFISVALAGSCSDALAPRALVGDYPLAAVEGAPPPRLVGSANGCTFTVTGGTLNFRRSFPISGSGDWSAVALTQVRDCRASGGDSAAAPVLYLGVFQVNGDALTFITALSDTDTLRWVGRVDGHFIAITVRDSIRPDVVSTPIAVRFGPQQTVP